MGDTRLTRTLDAEAARRSERTVHPRLVRALRYDRLGVGGGPAIDLTGISALTIGRGTEERVVREGKTVRVECDDPAISAEHARLIATGNGGFDLEDLGSRNGTFLDGEAIDRAPLADGALVEVGRTLFVHRVDADAELQATFGPTRTFSPRMMGIARKIEALAPTRVALLITGETGTGKEVVAREIHRRSGRQGPLVAVNCGALAPTVIESELFGHCRGAFTGATVDRAGLVEAAHGGTLFLDEIGELPLTAQTRLLRVLQENEIVRVGSAMAVRVDLRVVAATHRDLDRAVTENGFRADLHARLAGYHLRLPPLRERREDLGELVASFVRATGRADARARLDAARAIVHHAFPYNVRELGKVIEAALALSSSSDRSIDLCDLPPAMHDAFSRAQRAAADPELRRAVVEALRATDGNVHRAGALLGKHRQQVQRWMRRFAIRLEEIGA